MDMLQECFRRISFWLFFIIAVGSISTIPAIKAADLSVVKGTITWVDADRNLVVLQDGTNATALALDSVKDLEPGKFVELEGMKSPYFSAFANYPGRPTGSDFRSLFEGPTNRGNYYLSRMQGFLVPPITGEYRFWVASDDSSELWISTNSNPGDAQRIANVPGGHWTNPRQWDRYSQQQSSSIFLEAGKSYFIKAIAQQSRGKDYLGVAWAGPSIPQSVIDGRYLKPLTDTNNEGEPASHNGVLWEYWANFFSSDLSILQFPDECISNYQPIQIRHQAEGTIPSPIRISPGQALSQWQNFNLVEVEGYLNFAAQNGNILELELTDGKNSKNNISVRVTGTSLIRAPERSYIRIYGVCEGIRGDDGIPRAKIIWVNNITNVTWLNVPENWALLKPVPVSWLAESNLDLADGQWLRLRGRAIQKSNSGYWQVQGDDSYYGYTSEDGTNWASAGPPTELSMNDSVFAGFAVSSHQAGKTAEAKFDHVQGLSENLSGADIGSPRQAGHGIFEAPSYVVDGCGNDIWSVSDQCFFYHQPISGDREMIAHLASFKSDDPQAKACLMIRESLESGASWAAVVATPANNVGLQARQQSNNKAEGVLVTDNATWLKLVRRRSMFFVKFPNDADINSGQEVEMIGTLERSANGAFLNNARYRPALNQPITNSFNPLPAAFASYRTVKIGNLAEEAEKTILAANPVRFRISGIVTFNQTVSGDPLFLVQDSSGVCSVKFPTDTSEIKVGQFAQFTGSPIDTTNGLEFQANGFGVMGDGTMPVPLKFPSDIVEMGRSNGVWVEAEGIGRSISPSGQLFMMTRAGLLPVWCKDIPPDQLSECINAKIRIRGIYWKTSNPMLLLPSDRFIDVTEPAPEDPFGIPDSSLALLQTSPEDNPLSRRVKISGVVTCVRNHSFYVQNGVYGAQIESSNSDPIKVGDTVEVVGFPSKQPVGLVLSDSIIRPERKTISLPLPAKLSMDDVVEGHNNGLIVSVDARILERRVINGMQTLDLQNGQRVFQANLPNEDGRLPGFITGTTVRVVGVSRTESIGPRLMEPVAGDKPLVASLEVLLRSPQDVTILQKPPWWNWKYTGVAIGIPVVALIGSILWIHTLRRRVELRTKQLQETMAKLQKETQSAAILAERDRLAGEIHDSVEQGLSAIIMQMEAASKFIDQPDTVNSYLTMAKNMANFSRSEVQHAVWNLQSPMFENADLPAVLRRVAREISVGDSPRVTVTILGQVRTLPSVLEHHVLRIGQEALTNAIKHGQPNTIEIALRYESEQLIFKVRDDGRGFDPGLPGQGDGNFGLLGIRTRAQKLGATLNLNSRPAGGTTIELIVPLAK